MQCLYDKPEVDTTYVSINPKIYLKATEFNVNALIIIYFYAFRLLKAI